MTYALALFVSEDVMRRDPQAAARVRNWASGVVRANASELQRTFTPGALRDARIGQVLTGSEVIAWTKRVERIDTLRRSILSTHVVIDLGEVGAVLYTSGQLRDPLIAFVRSLEPSRSTARVGVLLYLLGGSKRAPAIEERRDPLPLEEVAVTSEESEDLRWALIPGRE